MLGFKFCWLKFFFWDIRQPFYWNSQGQVRVKVKVSRKSRLITIFEPLNAFEIKSELKFTALLANLASKAVQMLCTDGTDDTSFRTLENLRVIASSVPGDTFDTHRKNNVVNDILRTKRTTL